MILGMPAATPSTRLLRRLLALALLAAFPAFAADGDPDTTFSGDGRAVFDILDGELDEAAWYVRGLGDGSLLVAGRVDGRPAVLKVRADGTRDTSWGDDGWRLDILEDPLALHGFELLHDGRFYVAGDEGSGITVRVGRFLPNGEPDPSFGTGGEMDLSDAPIAGDERFLLEGIAVDRAGRLLAVGTCRASPPCDGPATLVARREPDGDPDPTWSGDGWSGHAQSIWNSILSCPLGESCIDDPLDTADDGSLVVATANGLHLLRFAPNGAPDPAFGGDGAVELNVDADGIEAVEIDPVSGKIYVALVTGSVLSHSSVAYLGRLLANGQPDTSFGFLGWIALDTDQGVRILDLELQSDGKLLAAGTIDPSSTDGGSFVVYRFLATGDPDISFSLDGRAIFDFDLTSSGVDFGNAITLVAGKPVLAGAVQNGSGNQGGAFGIARALNALLFADGFERGSSAAW